MSPKIQSLRRLPTFDCVPIANAKRPYLETNLDDIPENRVYQPPTSASVSASNRLSKSFDHGISNSNSNSFMYETSLIGSNSPNSPPNSSNLAPYLKIPPFYQSFDWTQHNSDVHFSPADRAEILMKNFNHFQVDQKFSGKNSTTSIENFLIIPAALDDTKNWDSIENMAPSKIPPPLYPNCKDQQSQNPEFTKIPAANPQQSNFWTLAVKCGNESNSESNSNSRPVRRVLSAQSSPTSQLTPTSQLSPRSPNSQLSPMSSSIEPPSSPSLFRSKFKAACYSTSMQAVDNTSSLMTESTTSDPKAIATGSCDEMTSTGSKTSSGIDGESSLENEIKSATEFGAEFGTESGAEAELAVPRGFHQSLSNSPVRKHVRFLPNDAECGWGGGGLLNVYTVDPNAKPESKLHASKSFTEASQLLQKYRALSIPKSVTVLEIDGSGGTFGGGGGARGGGSGGASGGDELRKSVYDNENVRDFESQKQRIENDECKEKPKPKPRLSKVNSPKDEDDEEETYQNFVLPPSQHRNKEPIQESGSFPMRKPRPFPRQPLSLDGINLRFERRASSSCSPQDFSLYDNLLNSNGFKQ